MHVHRNDVHVDDVEDTLRPAVTAQGSGGRICVPNLTANQVLTYIGTPDPAGNAWDQVKTVNLGGIARKQAVTLIGFNRWNTTLVRNLFFISNVARVVRMKLAKELTQYRSVLVAGHSMVNPSITEYGAAGFNPPETYEDQKYDSDARLL